MATDVELAYAAGLLDGEGNVTLFKWGSSYLPMTQVTNTDERMIDWLLDRFGGMHLRSNRHHPGHKTAHRWRLNGKHAASFLLHVLPYLVTKREQAELAISYYAGQESFHRGNRPLPQAEYERRKLIRDRMTTLNKRGIAVPPIT